MPEWARTLFVTGEIPAQGTPEFSAYARVRYFRNWPGAEGRSLLTEWLDAHRAELKLAGEPSVVTEGRALRR